MVAPIKTRRVVCTIVRVADAPSVGGERFVRKPSALLPWADPYIAGLVRRLQSEVRMERAAQAGVLKHASPEHASPVHSSPEHALPEYASPAVADLEPPSPMTSDDDFEWFDLPRFDFDRDVAE
jgi:hypothetical protein